MNTDNHLQIYLNSQADTELLASELSLFVQPNMALLLKGNLGAGKSTFARAIIRSLRKTNEDFEVPSPSFALVQSYDKTKFPVTHVDLYRTKSEADIGELDLAEIASSHLLIVEWPKGPVESFGSGQMIFEFSGSAASRDVEITAIGTCEGLLSRLIAVREFLAQQGWAKAERSFLDGDASSRRYERLRLGNKKAILMDMPNRPDGPPVKNGKPYSAIAHLAEGIRSVVAINDELAKRGYGAPKIMACDLATGLALIEDLGDEVFGRLRAESKPMRAPMRAAIEVLARVSSEIWPREIKMRDGYLYCLPSYDEEAQLIEVDLLTAWFSNYVKSDQPSQAQISEFHRIWANVLSFTRAKEPVWTLRDFHSPNLIWQPEKPGLQKVGLIDTQDALLGHPAYDLVSLLQDARVDISAEEEVDLYAYYVDLRNVSGPFDRDAFAKAYAVLGAQRATKILGIFARLAKRDGKLAYLKHLPRVSSYLKRNLEHPVLEELKFWFQANLPEAIEVRG